MKAKYFLWVIVGVVTVAFAINFFDKKKSLAPVTQITTSEKEIKNLPFGLTEREVIDNAGRPYLINNSQKIKKSIEEERSRDFWRGKQRNRSPVTINLGGISADKCLSYKTKMRQNLDNWMLCFKNDTLFAKIRLAKLGQESLVIKQ